MQTKLGAKFNILIDRLTNFMFGRQDDQKVQVQQGQNVVRVSQPLAGQVPVHQPSQADYLDRNQLLKILKLLKMKPKMRIQDFFLSFQNLKKNL